MITSVQIRYTDKNGAPVTINCDLSLVERMLSEIALEDMRENEKEKTLIVEIRREN